MWPARDWTPVTPGAWKKAEAVSKFEVTKSNHWISGFLMIIESPDPRLSFFLMMPHWSETNLEAPVVSIFPKILLEIWHSTSASSSHCSSSGPLEGLSWLLSSLIPFQVYIYIYVCVCVCVWKDLLGLPSAIRDTLPAYPNHSWRFALSSAMTAPNDGDVFAWRPAQIDKKWGCSHC